MECLCLSCLATLIFRRGMVRYKYFVAIGVVANDVLALERPFCMDTCLLSNIPSGPGVIPAT